MTTPDAFDWVTARVKCTPAEMFGKLRDVVEADVKTAQEHSRRKIELREHATDRFQVIVLLARPRTQSN